VAKVAWTAPALQDLHDIQQFIARDSPSYARITVDRIRVAAGRLAEFPRVDDSCLRRQAGDIGKSSLDRIGSCNRYTADADTVLVVAVVTVVVFCLRWSSALGVPAESLRVHGFSHR